MAPYYRAQFDGLRRLAAAVIIQATKDAGQEPTANNLALRAEAQAFLEGDMSPFSEVLELTPAPRERLPQPWPVRAAGNARDSEHG